MLKFGRRLSKQPSFICHIGNQTFKIFTLKGQAFKAAELQGNLNAQKSSFWMGQVLEVTPTLFSLKMKRGEPLTKDERQQAEAFMEHKLQQAFVYPLSQASEAFDFPYLQKLEKHGLEAGLISQAENLLKTVYLPLTSAHGDLHMGNMVCMNQHIKIIDWSMYSSKGSFVTDYIHFYNHQAAKKESDSWTKAILCDQWYLTYLAHHFQMKLVDLRLVYALSRISGEIIQRKDVSQVTRKEIKKYNFVLTQIIYESAEAVVQHRNSGV